MFYERRRYTVTDIADAPALAQLLTQHTWTLCTAFRLGDLFFVNDATGENGAQEYAVIRGDTQIESLTASWMTEPQMLACIERLQQDRGRHEWHHPVRRFVVDHHERCALCM